MTTSKNSYQLIEKVGAVKYALDQPSVKNAANDLGVNEATLIYWVSKFEDEVTNPEHKTINDIVAAIESNMTPKEKLANFPPDESTRRGRLAKLRKMKGYTVKDLASKIGVSKATINLFTCKGEMGFNTLHAMARALDTTMGYLKYGTKGDDTDCIAQQEKDTATKESKKPNKIQKDDTTIKYDPTKNSFSDSSVEKISTLNKDVNQLRELITEIQDQQIRMMSMILKIVDQKQPNNHSNHSPRDSSPPYYANKATYRNPDNYGNKIGDVYDRNFNRK